jgi:hypothetical protein
MSSCKKWNSCNNNCKRSGSNRGGGGGNGVIGKDGATGPTGPAGLQGPTGPAPSGLNGMIPYEPYNQNNSVSAAISLPTATTTTYIQFIAPSTGYYTKARLLTNEEVVIGSVSGETIRIRTGIYDNSNNYPFALPIPNNHGIPYQIKGQGFIDISGNFDNVNRYIDVTFDQSANLIMNEPYWFAYSTYVTSGTNPTANIFEKTGLSNGNDWSVIDISNNIAGGGPVDLSGTFTETARLASQKSGNATWFRLYDPSASFIVGPTGDCGCTGATGATGATGPVASAFKSYDFGVHILPQNDNTSASAPKVRLGLDSLSVMGGASRLSNAVISFENGPIGWIYPGYGGYAQFGNVLGQDISNVTILNQLNWSDRSSLPTGAWASKSSYSRPIGRTIDTDFTIDLDSEFSWVFGPYDGGNTVGGWAPTSVTPFASNMYVYIVKIPQTTYRAPVTSAATLSPDASGNWEWIKIFFDPAYSPLPPGPTSTAVGRCGSYTLRDMIAPFTHARPALQSYGTGRYNQVGTPITSTWTGLKFVPGDILGFFIGKQGMFYSKLNTETNEYYLISPATFSLKVKQT